MSSDRPLPNSNAGAASHGGGLSTSDSGVSAESQDGFAVPSIASEDSAELELARLRAANRELQAQLEETRSAMASTLSASPSSVGSGAASTADTPPSGTAAAAGEKNKAGSSIHSSIEGLETLILRVGPDKRIDYINTSMARYLHTPKDQVVRQELSVLRRFFNKEMLDAFSLPSDSTYSVQKARDDVGREFEIKVSSRDGHVDILLHDISEHERLRTYAQKFSGADFVRMTEEEQRTFRFPERRYMSVSFTDLRGFTAISETQTPEEVRNTLNAYLEEVSTAVKQNDSWVDKIVGDEMMALFGAPPYHKDHALRAIKTACDQIDRMRELQEKYREMGKIMPEAGVGVNTGDMVVGSMGSTVRQSYTVLGASVNLASRLCSAARGQEILLTEATLQSVLENLPEGWESRESRTLIDVPLEAVGGKTEGVLPLPDDQKGKIVVIGPGVSGTDAHPMFRFSYLYQLKVKGVARFIPVISVERPKNAETNVKVLRPEVVSIENTERIFGKYRLVSLLGRGGMGEVWRARDSFGNPLAIKILLAGESATESQIRRFKREAEVMSKLSHRNIVRIYEVGEVNRVPYLAMELIPGVSLADILKHKAGSSSGSSMSRTAAGGTDMSILVKEVQSSTAAAFGSGLTPVHTTDAPGQNYYVLPVQQTLSIVSQVCDGIQRAHEHGILHRDLKPGNIMIRPEGDPVVMDFGLAKLETGKTEVSLSLSGQVVGTLDYMAPEQATSSKDVNERADVYSIGAILYQMITGRKHFQSTGNILTDANTLQEHEPPAPRRVNRHIEPDLETIVLKALSPSAKMRYASVMQLAEDLKRYREGDPIAGRRITLAYRASKFIAKHRTIVALCTALFITLAVVGGYMFKNYMEMWGDWVEVYAADFTSPEVNREDFEFVDSQLQPWKMPVVMDSKGLLLEYGSQNVWLKNVRLPRDSRVMVDVRFETDGAPPGSYMDNFDLFINSRMESLTTGTSMPPGYSTSFGYMLGNMAIISRNDSQQPPDELFNSLYKVQPNTTYSLIMERRDNVVRLYVNDKETVVLEDVTPLLGLDLERIGFRSRSRLKTRVLGIKAYRLTLPKKSSPLIAGDALMDAAFRATWDESTRMRLIYDAIQSYRNIAMDFHGEAVSEEAILRAFAIANRWYPHDDKLIETLRELAGSGEGRTAPTKAFRARFLELEAIRAFNLREYENGFRYLKQVRELDPTSRVALTLLQERDGPLPTGAAGDLLRYLAKTEDLAALDVSALGLSGINELENAKLQILDISANSIESISALERVPLMSIVMRDNKISSLSALRNAPLVRADFSNNQVTSLEPLAGKPITTLDLSWNPLSDLSPLAGTKVEILTMGYTQVKDLAPLATMNLNRLLAQYCKIESIKPLQGLHIRSLNLKGNRISDLGPLHGMALQTLDISHNPVTSLAPLAPPADAKMKYDERLRRINAFACPLTTLEPFLHSPPDYFGFDSDGIPDAELESAMKAWAEAGAIKPGDKGLELERKRSLARLSRNVEVLLAIRRNELGRLRELATPFLRTRCLFVPKAMTWPEAKAFAEKVGARLVEIDSEEKNNFLDNIGARSLEPWIGYTVRDGSITRASATGGPRNVEDATGNEMFHRFPAEVLSDSMGREGYTYWSKGLGWSLEFLREPREAKRPFLIEWDNRPATPAAAPSAGGVPGEPSPDAPPTAGAMPGGDAASGAVPSSAPMAPATAPRPMLPSEAPTPGAPPHRQSSPGRAQGASEPQTASPAPEPAAADTETASEPSSNPLLPMMPGVSPTAPLPGGQPEAIFPRKPGENAP